MVEEQGQLLKENILILFRLQQEFLKDQGSLLFIIYKNFLINYLEGLPSIYTDDTTLISSETDTHKTTSQLNSDLKFFNLGQKMES